MTDVANPETATTQQKTTLILGDETFTFIPAYLSSRHHSPNEVVEGASCLPEDKIRDEFRPNYLALTSQKITLHFGINPAQLRNYFGASQFSKIIVILPGIAFTGFPSYIDRKHSALFKLRLHILIFSLIKSSKNALLPDGVIRFLWPRQNDRGFCDNRVPWHPIDIHKIGPFCEVERADSDDVSGGIAIFKTIDCCEKDLGETLDADHFQSWLPLIHNEPTNSLPPYLNDCVFYSWRLPSAANGSESTGDPSKWKPAQPQTDDKESNLLFVSPEIWNHSADVLSHVNELFKFEMQSHQGKFIIASKPTLKFDPRFRNEAHTTKPGFSKRQQGSHPHGGGGYGPRDMLDMSQEVMMNPLYGGGPSGGMPPYAKGGHYVQHYMGEAPHNQPLYQPATGSGSYMLMDDMDRHMQASAAGMAMSSPYDMDKMLPGQGSSSYYSGPMGPPMGPMGYMPPPGYGTSMMGGPAPGMGSGADTRHHDDVLLYERMEMGLLYDYGQGSYLDRGGPMPPHRRGYPPSAGYGHQQMAMMGPEHDPNANYYWDHHYLPEMGHSVQPTGPHGSNGDWADPSLEGKPMLYDSTSSYFDQKQSSRHPNDHSRSPRSGGHPASGRKESSSPSSKGYQPRHEDRSRSFSSRRKPVAPGPGFRDKTSGRPSASGNLHDPGVRPGFGGRGGLEGPNFHEEDPSSRHPYSSSPPPYAVRSESREMRHRGKPSSRSNSKLGTSRNDTSSFARSTRYSSSRRPGASGMQDGPPLRTDSPPSTRPPSDFRGLNEKHDKEKSSSFSKNPESGAVKKRLNDRNSPLGRRRSRSREFHGSSRRLSRSFSPYQQSQIPGALRRAL